MNPCLKSEPMNESTCVTTIEAEDNGAVTLSLRESALDRQSANEVDLIGRLQRGDEAAFREIVGRYGTKIHRVSYGILHNLDEADEVAQEVFAKVFLSIKNFAARCSLYSWIFRIAVNESYSVLRKRRFHKVHSDATSAAAPVNYLETIEDERPTPDQNAVQRDFVNKLLATIPEDDRWLLISKEIEGLSVAELSKMTGLNESTIKVKLFRVRQKLVVAAARLRPGPGGYATETIAVTRPRRGAGRAVREK